MTKRSAWHLSPSLEHNIPMFSRRCDVIEEIRTSSVSLAGFSHCGARYCFSVNPFAISEHTETHWLNGLKTVTTLALTPAGKIDTSYALSERRSCWSQLHNSRSFGPFLANWAHHLRQNINDTAHSQCWMCPTERLPSMSWSLMKCRVIPSFFTPICAFKPRSLLFSLWSQLLAGEISVLKENSNSAERPTAPHEVQRNCQTPSAILKAWRKEGIVEWNII